MRKLLTTINKKVGKGISKPRSSQGATGTDNEQCLHVLHEGATPALDIVAIHGDGGHWKRSWTDLTSGFCWLTDIVPLQFPTARILSFGYRTGNDVSVEEIAAKFMDQLAHLRIENANRPIIIVVHSFGGILIKGALAASHRAPETSAIKSIAASTSAVLLFGSPVNAGTELDTIAHFSLADADDQSETSAIKAMKRDARWLQSMNQAFRDLAPAYRMVYLREQAGDGVAELNGVEHEGVIQLNKTHGAMIRYGSAEDEDLKRVLALLGTLMDEILA